MEDFFLFMLHGLFEWLIGSQGQEGGIFSSLQKRKREVGKLGYNFIWAKVIYCKIYNVFEFPNVPRPFVGAEQVQSALVEPLPPTARPAHVSLDEMLDEQRDVLAAVSKGRERNSDHIDPVKEVKPEETMLNKAM